MYCPNTAIGFKSFLGKFPDEKAAVAYLEEKRWGGSVKCPRCGSHKIGAFGKDKSQHRCNNCHKPFNVKTNSIFEHSKIPLHLWLLAFYLITVERKGISSMQFSKELEITQKSAWLMCHKIREAMGTGKYNHILKGVVEFDEHIAGHNPQPSPERRNDKHRRVVLIHRAWQRLHPPRCESQKRAVCGRAEIHKLHRKHVGSTEKRLPRHLPQYVKEAFAEIC
ncbi:hypothetical protein R83H12_01046 [Fibrobacteria bacterium R8-3-H12]